MLFWCPGCEQYHGVRVSSEAGHQPTWGWNGDIDKPTFTPSILIRYDAVQDAWDGFEEWRTARVCHPFVMDGKIQFLEDCTHKLAGQTVELPDLSA
ncbi:MAG: ammonia monooxygenase [Candidatus Protistobacter heckmanni]|nr:ammonia monooxygenase [Candidatus Protistobacter heckmanni]